MVYKTGCLWCKNRVEKQGKIRAKIGNFNHFTLYKIVPEFFLRKGF
nr:MAG TPA: Thioredoxin domain-containing protein 5, Peroxiredoxin-4 family member, thioredoxin domain.92A [Caudoviricetes sp.]